MDWLDRLNRGPARVALGQGTVELLQWSYARHLPDNKPHRHTFFEVCQVGAYGAGRFTVQGQEHAIRPGDVFLARPGIVHQIVNTGQPAMELRWVCFQWLPAAGAGRDEVDVLLRAFAEAPVAVAADESRRVATLWGALQTAAGDPIRLGYEAQTAALIAALLVAIAQAGAGPHAPRAALEPAGPDAGDVAARLAVRFIHDNLNRALAVPEIAQHVHVSPRHLSRLFARFAETSPALYIAHARMDRARGLLRHSDLPIKEVAVAVGYEDVHHFTRVFARHFGCPPGEFRRNPVDVPNRQKTGGLI